jgi:hypothetical protein
MLSLDLLELLRAWWLCRQLLDSQYPAGQDSDEARPVPIQALPSS